MEDFAKKYLRLSQEEKDELALAIGRAQIKKRLEAERIVDMFKFADIMSAKETRARLIEIFSL